MPVSIAEFWKLAEASELLSGEACAALQSEFASLKGAAQQANARSLAQWLVARGRLTRYQASLLAAGRPGPFVFGPFVVTDRIDEGRLARVFRATHNGSDKALVVFLAQLTDDPQEHQHLIDLAQAAAAVKNAHVSRTYRAVRHRSQTFIVVEALVGESLQELLVRQKPTTAEACRLGFQAALGLVAMHAAGLAHGAVSPANIWIGTDGAAKVLQFPLVPPADKLRRREPLLVDYLAPELADPPEPATPLADIYSLGCVLFEILSGRVPFPGGTPEQKIARHGAEFPQRLDELNPQIPEELADLVAEMMAKDPLLRCQTASHVAHLLAPFASESRRGAGQPPKLDGGGLAPGYGAWKAPDWQAPPQQFQPAVKSPAEPGARDADESQVIAAEEAVEPAGHEAMAAIVVAAAEEKTKGAQAAHQLPFVVTDTPSVTAIGPPRGRTSKAAAVGIGVALAAVAVLVVATIILMQSDKTSDAQPSEGAKPAKVDAEQPPLDETPDAAVEETAADGSAAPGQPAFTEVDDDGQTLWLPPTAGAPLETAYLPNGAQVFLAVRPAELLHTSEGPKLLDALGPGGKWADAQVRTTLGLEPAQIEQLIVAFAPDETLVPQATFVARLVGDVPRETLLAAWGKPKGSVHKGKRYFEGAQNAYYLPEAGAGRVVVIAPPATMKQILELDGRPLLRSGVEKLLAASDAARHVNLVFIPSYLLTDGRSLLASHLDRLRLPLREFLDESIEAVLASAHVGEQLYVEVRAVAPVDRPPLELLKLLAGRWEKMPDRVESHVASLAPQPHGRMVIIRLGRMLQLARDFTRGAVENGQVVFNCYLPQSAAHNLVMGAELTLLESAGVAGSVADRAPPPSAPASAAEALRRKITLSFPRDSLDRVMDVLAGELGVEITILGPDLQLEGITKNQSLNNVDERDQPAGDILRMLLKRANPDGKLVYVIRPGGDGREEVVITTRAAAKLRGETLPDGF
jgi:hypothetical protein